MTSPLQKAPEGLLGALDLKTLGRSPSEFPSSLQAMIECLPFYLLRNRQMVSIGGAFVAIGVGIGGSHTVPNDEVWRVKSLGFSVSRVVGDIGLNIEVQALLRRATSASQSTMVNVVLPPVAATDLLQGRGFVFEQGFWMGPGDRLALTCNTTLGGGTLNLILDYERMPSG